MSDSKKDIDIKDQYKIQSNVSIFDTFKDIFSNNYHTFVVKKVERLASALYVITGFMPQDEPVRMRLRVCAVELITRGANPLELAEAGADAFEYRCAEVATILQTARYAGLISETNAQLIGEEYAALASFVRAHSGKIAERGQTLERSRITDPRGMTSHAEQRGGLLHGASNKKDKDLYKKNNDHYNRKSVILSIFNSKDEISIKDTLSLIPGVSEKTLQRDLMSLVEEGVLFKKGARRWTTYRRSARPTIS